MNRFGNNKLHIITGSYRNIYVDYTCTTDIKQSDMQPEKYIAKLIYKCRCTEGQNVTNY